MSDSQDDIHSVEGTAQPKDHIDASQLSEKSGQFSFSSSTIGPKPPWMSRLPSNGIGLISGFIRSPLFTRSPILATAFVRVVLSGHSIQAKTVVSVSYAWTALRKSVSVPSGTSFPQHSRTRIAPSSMNTLSALRAWSMNFCLFAVGTARTKPSIWITVCFHYSVFDMSAAMSIFLIFIIADRTRDAASLSGSLRRWRSGFGTICQETP